VYNTFFQKVRATRKKGASATATEGRKSNYEQNKSMAPRTVCQKAPFTNLV
jgi:hypothetical protein